MPLMSKLVKQLVMLQNLSKVSTYELRDSMPVNQPLNYALKVQNKRQTLYKYKNVYFTTWAYPSNNASLGPEDRLQSKPVIVAARIKCATG